MSAHIHPTAEADWWQWRERRAAHVSAPHGPLALTGTHWLDALPDDGVIPGLPGVWRQEDGRIVHEADGVIAVLETEGRPLILPGGRKALQPPAADGSLTVDLNRAQLPPCAFADAFICPLPPPGNTLPFALEAGERTVVSQGLIG